MDAAGSRSKSPLWFDLIDFGALFSQLFSTYWWLLPLLILASLFKPPWFKGLIGEAMVNLAARLFLDKNATSLTASR